MSWSFECMAASLWFVTAEVRFQGSGPRVLAIQVLGFLCFRKEGTPKPSKAEP